MAPATKSAVEYRKAILHEVLTIEFIHLNNKHTVIYRKPVVKMVIIIILGGKF